MSGGFALLMEQENREPAPHSGPGVSSGFGLLQI
jgi:hypothetical protein